MTSKRLLNTALGKWLVCSCAAVTVFRGGSRVGADVVTPISTLSQADRLSIFHDYSLNAVGQVSTPIAGSPGGGALNYLLGTWTSDPAAATRSYQISFTPLAGYDSNPEARRFSQAGEFAGGDLNAAYKFDFGPADATIGHPGEIKIFYDAVGAVYSGQVFKADVFQQTIGTTFHRSLFDNTLNLNFVVDDQNTLEHGDGFLNTVDLIPSVEFFPLPQSSLEIGYDFTRLDYEIRSKLARDPDADRHTMSARYHFYPTPQKAGPVPESPDVLTDILRQSLHKATVGYDYVFNNASGNIDRYEGERVYVGLEGLQIPGVPDLSFDTRYAHEWDTYKNPDYQDPPVLVGKGRLRRSDHLDVLTLKGNARLWDLPHHAGTLSSYAQFDIIADRSTVLPRHFNEYLISGGISYRF